MAYGYGLAAGATTLVGAIEGLEIMAYGGVVAGGGFITDIAIIKHAFEDTNSSVSDEVAHEVFESFAVSLEP